MKTIYLDRDCKSYKEVSIPSENENDPPVTENVDYIITDGEVIGIGVEFEKDGEFYRAILDDQPQGSLFQRIYNISIKIYIQTKGGLWKFERVDYYTLSDSNLRIYDTLDQNFGTIVRNDDMEGCVTEYQFFLNILGKGIYPVPFKMSIFEAYENLLKRLYA